MGDARITAEEGSGRYTLRFDYGDATRTALIDGLSQQIIGLEQQQQKQQLVVSALEAVESAARVHLAALIDAIVTATLADPTDTNGQAAAARKKYGEARKEYAKLTATNNPERIKLSTLTASLTEARKRLTYWRDDVTTVETRDAWCTTYTLGASGEVGTLEIPGEPSLVLIKPGAPAKNTAADGVLSARPIMTPEQDYFNVALLPGWQKFRPTYRWGTITGIDWGANTANVTLADTTSTAQSLGVNQTETLENVPVVYMTCHARAFSLGDRVVVSFDSDWSTPTVIGFLDNPRICPPTRKSGVGTSAHPACLPRRISLTHANQFDYGAPPFRYEITAGSLPPGLSFDEDTGVISGTASTAGTWSVSVRVYDALYDGVNHRYDDLATTVFTLTKGWNVASASFIVNRVATDVSETLHVETYETLSGETGWRCYSINSSESGLEPLVHYESGPLTSGMDAPCCPTSFGYVIEVSKTVPDPLNLNVVGGESGSGTGLFPALSTTMFNPSGATPGRYYTVYFAFSSYSYAKNGCLQPGGPSVPLADYDAEYGVTGFAGVVNFSMPFAISL